MAYLCPIWLEFETSLCYFGVIVDEFVTIRIHQVLNVKFYILCYDIIYFNRDLNILSFVKSGFFNFCETI
jgi:hypothetical protein